MRRLAIVALTVTLAGCAGNGAGQPGQGEAFSTKQERDAKDDAICRGYGLQPGTPQFIQCRMTQDQRRDNFKHD